MCSPSPDPSVGPQSLSAELMSGKVRVVINEYLLNENTAEEIQVSDGILGS